MCNSSIGFGENKERGKSQVDARKKEKENRRNDIK